MKDMYVIYGSGPCGKSYFVNNIIYDENIDKLEYTTITDLDFFQKNSNEKFYYRNLIIDDFRTGSLFDCEKTKGILINNIDNFDNLFIVCSRYTDYLKDGLIRPIIRYLHENKNFILHVHILDFGSGNNFNSKLTYTSVPTVR